VVRLAIAKFMGTGRARGKRNADAEQPRSERVVAARLDSRIKST
jgi:hypothetical protein